MKDMMVRFTSWLEGIILVRPPTPISWALLTLPSYFFTEIKCFVLMHSCILPLRCATIWQLLHHHHVHHMLVPSKQHFSLWLQLLLCPPGHAGHDDVKFIGPWKVFQHLQTTTDVGKCELANAELTLSSVGMGVFSQHQVVKLPLIVFILCLTLCRYHMCKYI